METLAYIITRNPCICFFSIFFAEHNAKYSSYFWSFFKEIDACRDGEEIYYFYSAGIFSIKEDGNFFTNRRVVSYWESPEDESYYLESATYEEIENIQINYTSSFLEDTEIIISKIDGNEFSLYISGEGQRDKIFVKKLMKYWRAQQGGI